MATDKSLNIRDIKAKEETAAALAELAKQYAELKARLDRIEQALAELSKPATKLQEASRSTAKK